MAEGFHDETLPSGVEAVWLQLHHPTPSLAMIVATFTFDEESGDLSTLLRNDYQTELQETHFHVPGRLGWLRSKIPWARPGSYSIWSDMRRVDDHKQRAYEALVRRHEEASWRWLTARFRGRFYTEDLKGRPSVRLLFTKQQIPLSGQSDWFLPVGLTFNPSVWRSTDVPGWAITFGRNLKLVAAARRVDAARGGDGGETLWHLTQKFHSEQSSLVVRWAMISLVALYAERLGELRDRAGTRRRTGRPVRQALDLDKFLLGDGLDASTVASDAQGFTADLRTFARHVVQYSEDLGDRPGLSQDGKPRELVPLLCESLRNRAGRLLEDMAATTANIHASAELRQAIANTRLQRWVLALTVTALVVAVVSLVVAIGG